MKVNLALTNKVSGLGFCKKILNATDVRTTAGTLEKVKFVEYDPVCDEDLAQIKELNNLWKNGRYTENIVRGFCNSRNKILINDKYNICHEAFYGLEDKNGNILTIADILDWDRNGGVQGHEGCTSISFIQTNPDEKYTVSKTSKRRYRGLGETLMAEIVKISKYDNKKLISALSKNEGFWKKSKLFKIRKGDNIVGMLPVRELTQADFDNYINYVENRKLNVTA